MRLSSQLPPWHCSVLPFHGDHLSGRTREPWMVRPLPRGLTGWSPVSVGRVQTHVHTEP